MSNSRDYGRIWLDLLDKYAGQVGEQELRRIHLKWKKLHADVKVP